MVLDKNNLLDKMILPIYGTISYIHYVFEIDIT